MLEHGEHFLARQAIFDSSQDVHAYEIFFRSGLDNYFSAVDGDMASRHVITDSFLVFGIEELTGKTRAFINFGRRLIVDEGPLLLPPEKVVIEILETIEPDAEVVTACRRLKDAGFTLALDDFVLRPEYAPLVDLADIIKVDFRQTPARERAMLARMFQGQGITLLAEKVETEEEHQEGLNLGYALFQGYYYSRPVMLSRRAAKPVKTQYLRFLHSINAADTSLSDLAQVIQTDVSLSLKLLRYLNSSGFGFRGKITSIQHALVLLGEQEVRRWGNLLAMAELSSDKPSELLRTALIRARLAELLAGRLGLAHRSAELFLLGLLSLLDAMLDQPIAEVLEGLPLAADLKDALRGEANRPGLALGLVIALERGEWQALPPILQRLGISEDGLPGFYLEAIRFPNQLWRSEEPAASGRPPARTGTGG
jgi:c-di-GMP-related signal transduction protein